MSTRPPSNPTTGRWQLHPRVALRPEPFGALAYHYGNRRLNFLRSAGLVELVDSIGRFPDPRSAYDDLGLDPEQWPRYARALDALAASDFLQPAPASGSPCTDRDQP